MMDSRSNSAGGQWTEPAPLVYLYTTKGVKGNSKIAAFDMDNTLIKTKSGSIFPIDEDDWEFLFPCVPKNLRAVHKDGFKIVIFTNQSGISYSKRRANQLQHKMETVIQSIGVPTQAMIAGCLDGMFRKPLPGMWTHICTKANDGVEVDLSSCFFVGDAAGRISKWKPGKKKDFSNCDRLFALNAGIRFSTPETFHNGEAEGAFEMPDSTPKRYLEQKEPASAKLQIGSQEMIVIVGFPGSGKTHFSRQHLHDYQHVNHQSSGINMKETCEEGLQMGRSLVIDDNANANPQSRAKYVAIAEKCKVPVRCFLMSTSYTHARHNRVYRQLTNREYADIDDTTVDFHRTGYKEPNISEGFDEVVKVNIVPEFDNEEQRQIYSMYLLVNDIYTPADILPTGV